MPFRFDAMARYVALAAGMVIAAGIMVNALMLQKGRHPAPLFGKAQVVAHAAKPEPVPSAATQSKPAPVPVPAIKQAAAVQPAPQEEVTTAEDDDPIARLLSQLGGSKRSQKAGTDASLVTAQKALIKLGFNVKANGTMTATTRKALESFEKSHHLPVKGELDRRTSKMLAAASGMRLD